MKHFLPIVFVTIIGVVPLLSKAEPITLPKKITIYCTSNLDGTGQCYEVSTGTLLKCTGVPGEIIPCKIPKGASYECIFFSEALLECNQSLGKREDLQVEKTQGGSAFEDDLEDTTNQSDSIQMNVLMKDIKSSETYNDKGLQKDTVNYNKILIMPTW